MKNPFASLFSKPKRTLTTRRKPTMDTVGSRRKVMYGTAKRATPHSRLKASDYVLNPRGRIVPKKKRAAGLKRWRNDAKLRATFKKSWK